MWALADHKRVAHCVLTHECSRADKLEERLHAMEAQAQAIATLAAPPPEPQPLHAPPAAPALAHTVTAAQYLPAPQFTFQPAQRNPPLFFDSRTATYQPDAAQGAAPGCAGTAASVGPPGAFRFSVSEPAPAGLAQAAAGLSLEPRPIVDGRTWSQPGSPLLSSDTRLGVLPAPRPQALTMALHAANAVEMSGAVALGDAKGSAVAFVRQASTVVITEVSSPAKSVPLRQLETKASSARPAMPAEGEQASSAAAAAPAARSVGAVPPELAAGVPVAKSLHEALASSTAALRQAGHATEPAATTAGPAETPAQPVARTGPAGTAGAVPSLFREMSDTSGKMPAEQPRKHSVGGLSAVVAPGQLAIGNRSAVGSSKSVTVGHSAQQRQAANGDTGKVSKRGIQIPEEGGKGKPTAAGVDALKLAKAEFSHLPPHLRPRQAAAAAKQVAAEASIEQPAAEPPLPPVQRPGTVTLDAVVTAGVRTL